MTTRTQPNAKRYCDRVFPARVPQLYPGFAADWPARLWTLPVLGEHFGDAEATAQVTARDQVGTRAFLENLRTLRLRVADVCRSAQAGSPHRPLICLTQLPIHSADTDLSPDMPGVEEIAATVSGTRGGAGRRHLAPVLFIGPAGTVTPLHYDLQESLLIQLEGRKAVALVPPGAARAIGGSPSRSWPWVTWARADPDEVPGSAGLVRYRLEPGDALFIPMGWWHHVHSLDPSISVNVGWHAPSTNLVDFTRHGVRRAQAVLRRGA